MPNQDVTPPTENETAPIESEHVLDVLSYWDWAGEVVIHPYGCNNMFGYG